MTVGALLLRPERVRAGTAAPTVAGMGADLLAVLTAVVADAARDEPRIPPAAQTVFAALGERVASRMAGGLEAAGERIGSLVDPLALALLGPVDAAGDDPAAIVGALGDVLVAAVDAAAKLDATALGDTVNNIVAAVTEDLGLTFDVLRAELLTTIVDIADRIAENELACAAALRRLHRRMAATPLPELDLAAAARTVLDDIRASGLDDAADLVGCVAERVREAAGHAASLADAVPFTGFGTRSVGATAGAAAAEERHAWYATWLLGYKRPLGTQAALYFVPWEGPDEVWVADGQVTRRNKWRADQSLGPGADWPDALIFSPTASDADLQAHGLAGHVAFDRTIAARMEEWALWSAVTAHLLEVSLHALSLEEGDRASNALQMVTNTISALMAGGHRQPLPWWLDHLLLRTGITLATSLEGMEGRVGNRFAFWLTLAGPDFGEVVRTHLAVHAGRDLFLSGLTLNNHRRPPGDQRKAHNRLESRGFTRPGVFLGMLLAAGILPRTEYKLPFLEAANPAILTLHWLVVAPIIAMFGFTAGWLAARSLAADFDDTDGFDEGLGSAIVQAALAYWPVVFHLREGNTAAGTYNPNGPSYAGYPAHATSPYRLPWAEGVSRYAGQGNQGFFSHHLFTSGADQVYAFDFGLDSREPVLAARPGTVVKFKEDELDGSTGDENFIRIRHDVDNDGNLIPPDPVHDRDAGGERVRTYATYMHGANMGISPLFGGAPPTVGKTRVRQGQPIMLAGDTGNSFHNHLHVEVVPDDGTSGLEDKPDPTTGIFESPDNANATGPSLPFVFADVEHRRRVFGRRAGVPYRLNFYTAGGKGAQP